MNLLEELDACKFEDNEYLVEHLMEVVKDEGINTLDELKNKIPFTYWFLQIT